MKMNKLAKRIIAGGLGVIMMTSLFVGVPIHNMGDVQAKTKVFDQIATKYPSNKDFSILEIIPEIPNNDYHFGGSSTDSGLGYDANDFTFYLKDDWNTNHKFMISSQSEFGYFLARTPKDTAYSTDAGSKKIKSAAGVTQGGLYGNPIMQTNDANYQNFMKNMYQYGMIKPDGWDSKGFYNANHSGDYPVFADTAIFSEHYNATTNRTFSESMAKGVYTSVSDNSGLYQLADGYKLNDQHAICKVTVSQNQIGEIEDPAVSGNMIPVYEDVEILEEVPVDTTRMILPQSPDGTVVYVTYKGEEGGGNLTFARSQVATTNREYFGFSDLSVYYTDSSSVIYFSSDWFRELVLGDNNPNSGYGSTKIKYETVYAKNVTTAQIEDADLIYISGKDILYTKDTNDISEEVLLKLYNEEVLNHKAVMMDYALYNGNKKSSEMTNIAKLALLLWQDGQSTLRTMQKADFADSTKELTDVTFLNKDSSDTVKTLKEGLTKVVGNTNGNFVRGNVYVYNHLTSVFDSPKSKIDALDNFANGDFNTAYTSGVMTEGFAEIITYINAYNKNSMTGGLGTSITPAVAIQYILISDGSTITMMKNSLRVLEIQPVPAYLYNPGRGKTEYFELDSDNTKDAKYIKNRKEFVQKYLSNYYSEDIDNLENSMLRYIEFTSMTVKEFNGHNEDLVENYDIIYIGDETARQDTVKYTAGGVQKEEKKFSYYKTSERNSKRWNASSKSYENATIAISDFEKNPEMNGMIYYSMGEEIGVVGQYRGYTWFRYLCGFIDGEDKMPAWNQRNGEFTARYSGRDITKNKLKKMKEFLISDGLILVAEDLLGNANSSLDLLTIDSINPTKTNDDNGRVDNSSNLYELLAYGLGYSFDSETRTYKINASGSDVTSDPSESISHTNGFENLVSTSYVEAHPELREELSKYVSSDKVYVTLRKCPTPYTYSLKSGTNVIDPTTITYMDETNGRYLEYEFFISTELDNVSEMYNVNLYVDLNNDGKYSKTTEVVGDFTLVETASGREAVKDENGDYVLYGNGTNYTLKRKLSDEYCGFIKWKLEVQSTDKTKSYMHGSQEGYTLVKNITGEDKKVNILQITEKVNYNADGSVESTESNLNLQWQLYNKDSKWGKYLNDVADYDVHIKTLTMAQFQEDFKAQFDAYNAAHPSQTMTAEAYAVDVYFKDFYLEKTADDAERKFKYTEDAWKNQYNYAEDIKGVNMLVLGFGDNFDSFNNDEATRAVEAFVESGKPVLMTHDFLTYDFASRQTRELRNYIGMDKYGVTQNIKDDGSLVNRFTNAGVGEGYLHAGTNYTSATNKAEIELIEKTGKEVTYVPGSGRNTVSQYKQGYTDFIMTWKRRWHKQSEESYVGTDGKTHYRYDEEEDPPINRNRFIESMNGVADINPNWWQFFGNYEVNKLNDGQITQYPYCIPDSFRTQTTHAQYLELDLTSDSDNDGESDVVVWYTLGSAYTNTTSNDKKTGQGENMYDDIMGCSADPAQGFYIYNKNNVTYTGAGHSNLEAADTPEEEIQLFVNCLLAAFETGLDAPSAGFYESVSPTARKTTCITIPYDENVTGPTIDASGNVTKPGTSVLVKGVDASGNQTFKYKFVDQYQNANTPDDDKTMAYFRVSDTNLVRGNKTVDVKYYLKVESNMIQMEPGHENDTEYFGYVELYGQKLPVERIAPTDSVASNTVNVVDVSGVIATYNVDQKTGAVGSLINRYTTTNPSESDLNNSVRNLDCDKAYGIYLPMFQLNKNASFTIYMQSTSVIKTVLNSAGEPVEQRTKPSYKPLTVTKADLMDLD